MSILRAHHLALILTAIIQWFIGAIWYSPVLFGRPWLARADKSHATKEGNEIPGIIAFGVVCLIVSYVILYFLRLTGEAGLAHGGFMGLMLWAGFVAAPLFALYINERRSFRHYFINAGYWLVALIVGGAVLGRLR
jgi:hypothetical protein